MKRPIAVLVFLFAQRGLTLLNSYRHEDQDFNPLLANGCADKMVAPLTSGTRNHDFSANTSGNVIMSQTVSVQDHTECLIRSQQNLMATSKNSSPISYGRLFICAQG